MREWKCKQVIDFDKSTTTVKEERNRTLHQTKDKYNHFLIGLHWHPIGSYSSDDPQQKKVKAQPLSLIGHVKLFWMWIVKSDRQFCRTVYVISWNCSSDLFIKWIQRFKENLEYVLVSFQDFVGKTRNFSVWVVPRFGREEGYTSHRILTSGRKSNIEILFIDELLGISESRTLHF